MPSKAKSLDSAAEVYAIAAYYADEGDPELLRRVRVRLEAAGIAEVDVIARIKERVDALDQEHAV